MKLTKRFFALLTALLMTLSLIGCLVPKEEDTPADTSADGPQAVPAPDTGDSSEPEFDGEAIAVELGSIQIKANDVANLFDSYIGMFSYSGSINEEIVDQCFSMAEDEIIRNYVPLWKAEELGVALSEEEELELNGEAHAEVEEERDALLCQFAYYYGATDEIPESASQLTQEQLDVALNAINEQLAQMFHEGFVFDDYLQMEHDSILEGLRIDKLSETLKANLNADEVDTDAIDAWYESTLEAQKKMFDENPLEYYYHAEGIDVDSESPVLYVPEGYIRVQVIRLAPNGEPDEKIEANATKMKDLEAEYGALMLNNENPDRQAEIAEEYAALKAENDALEEGYYGDIRTRIDEAYAALEGGATFEDVMKTYNGTPENESGLDERLVYVNGADPRNGSLGDYAKDLEPGTYSKPVLVDDAYVIVKLIEVVKAGPVDRASIEEEVRIAAMAALREDAWEAQFDEWLTEAKEKAVFHRETYEMIKAYYLPADQ